MLRYFKKIKKTTIESFIFYAIYSLTLSLFPLVSQKFLDNYNKGYSYLINLFFIFLIIVLLNLISEYFNRVWEWKLAKEIQLIIKGKLFDSFISQDKKNFDDQKSIDYVSIINNNVSVVYDDYFSAIIDLIKNISKLLIFCTSMVYVLNLQVMFVILLFSMLTSILPNLTQSRLSTLRKQDLKTQKTYNKTLLDLFEGHKYVTPRTFNVFQKQHLQILNLRENEHYRFGKFRVLSDMIFSIGTNSMYLIIFLLTGYFLIDGHMSLGAVSASLLYTNDLTGSISDVLSCINVLNSSKQVVSEMDEYLKKPILSEDLSLSDDVNSFKIENLKFKRNDLELLLDSFKISNEEAVAIIGSSGSGKSTFIEIISGNLNIENGDFFNSSKLLNSDDLKKLTFTLHQREHLFDTDFINNATIFNQFPMTQISLNLMELLPKEMTNRLLNYQKVDDLSGGEKQVVSIIRLLNMDYPILLMDEPFASIDKNTKEIILDYILSTNNKIIFEVTHDQRKETLNKYDKILKIENGNIQNIK